MSDFFSGKKRIDSIRQAPNLANLLCKSKFMPVEENFMLILAEKVMPAAHI